ncbi:MAG: hypothetical protein II493_08735, partial [Spirochaetales bacterium]|nr:hypothetical protein [Spirochaetales bacterium]
MKLVLAMDVILSVVASGVVLLLYSAFPSAAFVSHTEFLLTWLISSLLASGIMFLAMRTYAIIIRHTSFKDLVKFTIALGGKVVMMMVSLLAFAHPDKLSIVMVMLLADLLLSMFFVLGIRILMILIYDVYKSRIREVQKCKRLLVYGTSEKSESAISRFKNSPHYNIVGVISPISSLKHAKFADKSIYYFENENDVDRLALSLSCNGILFTKKADARVENDRLVKYCADLGLKVLILPEIGELGEDRGGAIREVRIEDLLGRDEIQISMPEIKAGFAGKTVLVTGAAGSIGSELCRQLAT